MCAVLLLHVEAHAHALVVLAQVAHSVQRGVAAQARKRLEHGEQLLRLEGVAQPARGAGYIAGHAHEQAFHLHGTGSLVIGPRAAQRNAVDLGLEAVVLVEGKIGVAALDAHLVVGRQQLLVDLCGSHSAASLGQQVLAGESASRLLVFPSAIEVAITEFHTAYHQIGKAVDGRGASQRAQHTSQQAAAVAAAGRARGGACCAQGSAAAHEHAQAGCTDDCNLLHFFDFY